MTARRALALAACCGIAAPCPPAAAPQAIGEITVAAGATFDLQPGASERRPLRLVPGRPWRIAVEQIDVDVSVTLIDPDGEPMVTVDRPLDRDGVEYVFVRPESGRPHTLEVRSLVATAIPGRVRVSVEDLGWSNAAERSRWLAEQAETRAAAAYARGGIDGWREALAGYRRALEDWQRAGEREREALAVYSIGVLHRLLEENPQALEHARRAVDLFAALEDPSWRSSALNEIGLLQKDAGELDAARASFELALTTLGEVPDPFRRIIFESNICLTSLFLGAMREGAECYERVLPLYDGVGDPQGLATSLASLGVAYLRLGEPDRALATLERALPIQEASGDLWGQGLTLNNLALLESGQGDLQRALVLYGRAADLFRQLEKRSRLALVLANTGAVYWRLGETSRARSFFAQALPLQRELGNRRGEAHTLTLLATLSEIEGDRDTASELLERALALQRQIDNRRGEGRALGQLGRLLVKDKQVPRALELLDQAAAIARQTGDQSLAAQVDLDAGRALAAVGRTAEARDRLGASLERSVALGQPAGETEALVELARLDRGAGDLERALGRVAEAISRIEARRARIASPDLKASFLAVSRQAYELDIDLLMDLHRADPSAGRAAQALAAGERARARSLLDLLSESAARIERGVDPELAAERQRLLRLLDAADRSRRDLLAGEHTPEALAASEAGLESVLGELDRLEIEIRRRSPRYSDLLSPTVLSAPEISRLAGPNTVLLVFSLGDERSYLWWVEDAGIVARELPPRAEIERLARRFHAELSVLDVGGGDRAEPAAHLADAILGPVSDRLRDQRLVVVADGALHRVPFAALPSPGAEAGPGELLIERHEITYLPSASALAEQRRLYSGRPPARRRALVIADPVFGRDDPRLAQAASPASDVGNAVAETTRDARQVDPRDLARLPATRREAESIVAVGGAGEVRTALGFDASRALAVAGGLADYRIVHFATHALVDDRTPLLSGVVLSMVDEDGTPVDGFLRLSDVYRLELGADLVVLSGCETASGREVRGEGLVGLTRGFMYAGAPRVVASLWRNLRKATAELMGRFYQAMWAEGSSPSAALRAAQLSLRSERRWRDPFYWAAFVVQGDWRPRVGSGSTR